MVTIYRWYICHKWVCLKMLYTPKANGFADHYPYEKWLFHWEYTQHFQTNPSRCRWMSSNWRICLSYNILYKCHISYNVFFLLYIICMCTVFNSCYYFQVGNCVVKKSIWVGIKDDAISDFSKDKVICIPICTLWWTNIAMENHHF